MPFHTWLPDAGAEAPVGGAALLVGVLDKVGTFGFLRYCLPLFPDASRYFAPTILILSVIGILYAAFLAIGQRDMKRLVAYTSVAHFGFIGIGIFAFTTQGGTGAVLYMVNHGLSTGVLFLVVGMLIARGKSRLVADYGGAAKVTPMLAGVFLLAGLSALALPGHEHVRQRVPGAGRHVHPAQGAGDPRHHRHHPGRALRAVPLPAHDAGRRQREGREVPRPQRARGLRGRPADRADPVPRRLPEAGARRDQSRRSRATLHDVGKTDPAPGIRHRSRRSEVSCSPPLPAQLTIAALDRLPRAVADPHRARRRAASACWSRRSSRATSATPRSSALTVAGLVAALVAVIAACHGTSVVTAVAGALAIDGAGLFLQGTILVLAIVAAAADRRAQRRRRRQPDRGAGRGRRRIAARPASWLASDRIQTEVFPLAMFAVGGMLIFPVSNNLLLMFVALEVLSLPLYLMAGLARRRRLLSQEAAIKYFLLGAFASAFFLYGLALLYGYANSVDLAGDPGGRLARRASRTCCSTSGSPCCSSGCCSRPASRRSTPGRRTSTRARRPPVTAFMASCTKVAAFGAILRVLYVGFRIDQVGLAARSSGPSRSRRWWSARLRADPDRHEADARLLLDRARRVHPGRHRGA